MEGSVASRKRKRAKKGNLSDEMQRCLNLLNAVQARNDAAMFLEPVDWKGLNLLDYRDIVKKPMDLGTVETKLYDGKYKKIQGFAKDVRLVFSNAQAYNMEESDIYKNAEALSDMFERKFEEIVQHLTKMAESEKLEEAKKAAEAEEPPPKKKAKVKSEKKAKPEKKPEKKSDKSSSDPWKQCMDIVKNFQSKPNAALFLEPVDWEAAGLMDYPILIKQPMDLGTIESKLSGGEYKGLQEFATDVRLVWNNAMQYNVPASEIYQNAAGFLETFEKKWKKINKNLDNEGTKMKLERQKFCDILRGIETNEKLGKLVLAVQRNCPSAMEMKNGKEIVIQVSKLDSKTLEKLMKQLSAEAD